MATDVVDKRRKDFFILDDLLIDTTGISAFAKIIYAVIARHADKDGFSFPGTHTIASKGGMSAAAVKRYIPELEALNMIRVHRENGRPNKYFLLDKSLWLRPVTELTESLGKEDTQLPQSPVGPQTELRESPFREATSIPQSPVPVSHRAGKEDSSNQTHTNYRQRRRVRVLPGSIPEYPGQHRQVFSREVTQKARRGLIALNVPASNSAYNQRLSDSKSRGANGQCAPLLRDTPLLPPQAFLSPTPIPQLPHLRQFFFSRNTNPPLLLTEFFCLPSVSPPPFLKTPAQFLLKIYEIDVNACMTPLRRAC